MSKYTKEELSEMARVVLQDRREGGMQSFQLVIILATALDMEPEQVMNAICKMVIR